MRVNWNRILTYQLPHNVQIPGYIAGVTNPMFQQHDAWFDLLCILDVPNGRGTVISAEEKRAEDAAARGGSSSSSSSSNIASAASTAGAAGGNTSGGAVGVAANSASKALASIAAPLMDGALSVEQMDSRCVDTMLSGLALGFGEDWIRVHCRDYVDTLVQQTLDITYGKGIVFYDNIISRKQKQMEALYPRVNRIMQSAEFRRLAPHPWFRIDGLAECRNEDAAVSGNSGAVSSSSQESRLNSSVAVLGFGATLATSCRGPKGDTDPSFNSAGSLVDGINDELLALLNNVVPLDGISVRCYLRVLQLETNIPAEYVHQIYHDINAMINTEKQLQALITLLPESPGGLAVIAVGLFHTHPDTRVIVANIIYKLEQCASTRHVVARLNGFYLRAYHRVLDSLRLSPPRPSSAPGSRAALRL
jgi:general stress protein YciG